MADIFISYSSKDREKAEMLTEMLSSAGLSVWIDQQGIIGAEKWATEIVDGINSCSTFLVLLSQSSVTSENVLRELSLASEKRKRVLPVNLEIVQLPSSFEYPLAGLQRLAISDFDGILRAHKHGVVRVRAKDSRKSLMVLPFEDLSSTQDNAWFADGIASELIGALSTIKSIRVIDWNTTRSIKRGVATITLAREFDVRYFVEGQVRKFGDKIKISVSMLDIDTGDHLWRDSMQGEMADIFDFQETVSAKVVEGLQLHLDKEEKAKLQEKLTENVEAYELYLKGVEYYARHTRGDYERALSLFEKAVHLDPDFAAAHAQLANVSLEINRVYSRVSDILDRVEVAAGRIREIEGETAQYFWIMSRLVIRRGDAVGALRLAKRAVETDPKYARGYSALYFAYQALSDKEGMVYASEEDARLRENDLTARSTFLFALHAVGDTERLCIAAEVALPLFERHVRLNPDDYPKRVFLATIFQFANRTEAAIKAADELSAVEALDGVGLFNLACLYLTVGQPERVMEHLHRAVAKGYRNIDAFRRSYELLRSVPEYEPFIIELEKKIESEMHG